MHKPRSQAGQGLEASPPSHLRTKPAGAPGEPAHSSHNDYNNRNDRLEHAKYALVAIHDAEHARTHRARVV